MKVMNISGVPRGAIIETDAGTKLRLEAWREDIIRFSYTKGSFAEKSEDIVTASAKDVPFALEDGGGCLTFSAGKAAVRIKKNTFGVTLLRDGERAAQLSHWGMQLRDTDITLPHYTADKNTKDQMKHLGTDTIPGCKFYLSFDFDKDEKIYGLGQYDNGALNRREVPIYMYQTNNQAPVPFFVSSKGYGILVDTGAYSSFTRDTFGTTFYTDSVEMGDFYYVASNGLDGAVKGYRFLTGGVPMMPKWLFGYTQCKEHYHTQEELLGVLREYRRRGIPLDHIVQDWHYWTEDVWSDKSFDTSRYPDPGAMCDEVHDANAHIMISVWPNTRGGESFRELFEKDQLLGDGQVYNVFDPDACDTYWNQLSQGILKYGFDAWWCDCSEPYEPRYGEFIEADELKAVTVEMFKRYFDSRRINLFSLLHSKNVYEHQRRESEKKRVVNLTRSGYAGQQRYGAIVWSGDIEGSFMEMKKQIAEGLNFCASGLPYWTLDIGGFWSAKGEARFNAGSDYTSNRDPGFRELYTRWLQLACFLPVFRSHGTCFGREIWCMGEEGEMFYESIRKFIQLRYKLLPYVYSTARQVSKNDETFIRMLAFDFADDPKALEQEDTFLFGRAFLVSPVTEPQYFEGADIPLDAPKEKNVYLPVGADWYDYWTGERYVGGQTVTAATPIDSMPLFVRAGSIVPTSPAMQYVDEIPDAPYTVTVYPGADGDFTLYEDRGDGYDYEKGACAEYDLHWDDKARTLSVSSRRGSFEGMCVCRKLILRTADGCEKEISYNGEAVTVTF